MPGIDLEAIGSLGLDKIRALIEEQDEIRKFQWERHARPTQLPPPGNWRFWVVRAGRGFGKTRTGAEYIRHLAKAGQHGRIALIGPTAADVRDVMVEGDSGILACSPQDFMPLYEPSKRQLTWPNGVIAKTYSADEPDRLRGPQHHAGWIDELSAFEYPETFTQFKLGFRLGRDLRCVITMTPKPCAIVRELEKQSKQDNSRVIIVRGSTYDNKANLAPEYFEDVIRQYEGTRLGRQELDGELLEDTPGALWSTVILERTRHREALPEMSRIVVAIDPSVTSSEDSDECGISVCGKGFDGDGYVLADRSAVMTPHEWAHAAIAAYHEFHADVIVAETNNGGDLVGNTILAIDPSVPFRKVTASRGKVARAEPISALFEQNRAHLAGNFAKLEEQLCAFASDGYTGKGSPDRADAMVWACSELMLNGATVQMFPDFRTVLRKGDPPNACHIEEPGANKPWWPRWVSATIGQDAAAHWWVREPSGITRIYRELTMRDVTADEFGVKVAELSRPECASTRMVPVWMSEKAFEATAGKSVASSFYQGITRSLGEHKAFLFVHNDVERILIEDPGKRLQAIESRLSKMPHGFLSVQKVRGDGGDKKNAGWDVVREMLKWRTAPLEAKPQAPDWDFARRLAATDIREYQQYISQFEEAPATVAPILRISAECRALIQAMSGAARTKDEEERLATTSGSFVLQSLRVGALASREEQGRQPMEEFVGARLDGMDPNASPISKHLAEVRAEGQWNQRNRSRPVKFQRVRRGR